MSGSVWSRFLSLTAAAAVLCLAGVAQAASGSWSGSSDAFWTNAANWSASPFPAGVESAYFTNGSAHTTVDVQGLSNISNIVFDTADVVAYTLGAGAANSQTLVMGNGGEFRLGSTADADQTFAAAVQLGSDNANLSFSIRNDNPAQTLTLNNVKNSPAGGNKTLNISGSGPVVVQGALDRVYSSLVVNHNTTNTLTLAGNNSLNSFYINGANSVINLSAGTTTFNAGGGTALVASQDAVINGPGKIVFSTGGGDNYADNGVESGKTLTINAGITGVPGFEFWHSTYRGTFVLAGQNDFYSNVIMNVAGTISVGSVGNQGSTTSNLGRGQRVIFNSTTGYGGPCRLLYTGTGEDSNRLLDFRGAGGIVEQAGSGNLKFTTSPVSSATFIQLRGSTAGTGEIAGSIPGSALLAKAGTGTWYLSGSNTYSGATSVDNGTLAIRGLNGATANTSGYAITNGATLRLDNTSSANNTNRLRDAAAVTMNGGTVSFSNDGSSADYSENAGALIVNLGASTVTATPAPTGKKSALRFASITRMPGATVNFTGTGLGDSDENRIFITGQGDGLIGSWATVNGSTAAYSSTRGVYVPSGISTVNITALGPSVIPDSATTIANINDIGTEGPIALAAEITNKILQVQQNVATGAVVRTLDGGTNKTLQVAGLTINDGMSELKIGENAGEGYVQALSPGGSISVENMNAAETLTINASVIDNGAASSLTKSGPGRLLLTASNAYSGVTGLYEGELEFGGGATQTIAGVISGGGSLVKTGAGHLTLSGANTYAGATTISNGTVLVKNNAALGASTAGTLIANGGTLDIGGSVTAQAMNLNAEQITVSGAGVNGRGAIINSSNVSQYNALRLVTMAGDATFGGELSGGRWDIRNVNGTATLNMNGYTLSKVGTNQVGLTSVGVTPGATGAIDIKEGNFTIEANTTMGGNAGNVMTVRSGAIFDIWSLVAPVDWSLVMEDRSRFYARDGNATNRNIWAGPVTLNGTAIFDAAGTYSDTIRGAIGGVGSVVKTTGNSTTYFINPNNTYAGTTIVSNGTLYAKYAGSLPGYNSGKVTVTGGGTLATHATDGFMGWTAEQIRDLNAWSSFTADNAVLSIDTTLAPLTIPYDLTNRMGITKYGTNTLMLSGVNSCRADTRVQDGTLVINGTGNHAFGMVLANTASVVITNDTSLYINITNNKSCYIGDDANRTAKMLIGGKTAWASYLPAYNVGAPTLVIGQRGRATLTLDGDASVTNRLYMGAEGSGSGAVYQKGNTVMHNWGGASSDGRIGLWGYGYYELNSGVFTNNGYTHLGQNRSGVGILKQTGGAFKQGTVYGGQLGLSRGGTGVVFTAGGTFNTASQLNVGESSENGTIQGYAEFTVDNTADVKIGGNGQVYMADRTNMFAAVNLNGGSLGASQFLKGNRTGALALVNFDGGTFVARAGGNIFGAGATSPDFVNIYGGGAVFDTTNFDCTVTTPLRAPAGSGVTAIAVTPRDGYIGPPMVTIAGGGGTGATAIAQFDSNSGTVSGILMTCPGFNYATPPTVTLSGGGTNVQTAVGTVSLSQNVSGGLTKLGTGALVLTATNTYGGATTVSNGTLRIGVAGALPTGSDVNVSGGALDMGGLALTNGAVTVSAGSIVNGSLVSESFVKTGSGALTLAAHLESETPIIIGGGTLKLQAAQPGLYEGVVPGASNSTSNNPNSAVALTTRAANGSWGTSGASGGIWTDNTTYIYSGYLWNRQETNVTWTFAEQFDDWVLLKIDGTTLINGGTTWNVATAASKELTPGAHAFELRLGQGGGGVGAPTVYYQWWQTFAFSFGYDTLGRNETNIANYAVMTDPGNGSLFTLTAVSGGTSNLLADSSSIQIEAGAVLDLDTYYQEFVNVDGGGMISNGYPVVTGTLSPAGSGSVGTLTFATTNGLTLAGTLLADVDGAGGSDRVVVNGPLTLTESSTLEIVNTGLLDTKMTYILAETSGGVSGAFGSTNLTDNRWLIRYTSDGKIKLSYVKGTVLMFR